MNRFARCACTAALCALALPTALVNAAPQEVSGSQIQENAQEDNSLEKTKDDNASAEKAVQKENAADAEKKVKAQDDAAKNAALLEAAAEYPEAARFAPFPNFSLHGNYRVTYGEGRIDYPAIRQKIKAYQVSRRLQLYPSVALNREWTVTGMLEDIRYDREYPEDHASDNHLYLDRLYVRQTTDHGTRFTLGRENLWPIEGNLFDLITEGVRYEFGNAEKEGRADLFFGRTVGKSSRLAKDRKNGVLLSYLKKWPKWQTGLYYYDFNRDDDPFGVPAGLTDYVSIQNIIDRQRIGELYVRYGFNEHASLEFEGVRGHATTDSDHWTDTAEGYIVTLRLRQQPNLMKPGDYGFWFSYYNMPRATYIAPTLDADVTIFGRSGFTGFGTRLDVVLARGTLLQVMYYDLTPESESLSLAGLQPFEEGRERVIATTLRQFF